MNKYARSLTPAEIASVKDAEIDFSDIPELDASFWREAEFAEPDRTDAQGRTKLKMETEHLVQRVLASEYPTPPAYREDLSYQIIETIRCRPKWRQEYEALGEEATVNQWIGKAVKALCPSSGG